MALRTAVSGAWDASRVPECAESCLSAISPPSNLTRICQVIDSTRDACILSDCGIQWALSARIRIETACGTPVRDRRVKLNVMLLVFGGVTCSIVLIRLIYQQFYSPKRRLEMQDWAVAAATVMGIACIGIIIFGLTARGLGMDIWGVPRSHLRGFGLCFYITTILYIILISTVKIGLCLFYLNLFRHLACRRFLWATVAFHVGFAIAFAFALVFQCNPLSDPWTRYDLRANVARSTDTVARCIDVNATGWASAAINVASDLWLLAIPVFQIRKLSLHWKKKIGAVLMFEVGACVTVISILRLKSFHGYLATTNPTWDEWDLVWWSAIEVQVALICTCLPTIRLALVRLAPQIFGSTSHADRQDIPIHRDEYFYYSNRASSRSNPPLSDNLTIMPERLEIRTRPLTTTSSF